MKKTTECRREKKNRGKLASGIKTFKTNLPLTILALPSIVFLFVFCYMPLYGLLIPFKNYKVSLGIWGSKWVGLENFKFLVKSHDALRATANTVLYNVVFILVGTSICILIALMLFEMSRKVVKASQTMLLLPYFLSWVVVSYALRAFLDMDYGMFNKIRETLGLSPIMWYNEPKYWPPILLIAHVWKGMGYSSLIYYASLMSADEQIYEAARVDGAGRIAQIWHLSIPNLMPMISMMLILNIGRIFSSDFGMFYNLPLDSTLLYPTTDVLSTFTYRALMGMGDIGMSAAASFYQSVVGFFLVIVSNAIVKKINPDNAML